jgi:hypothetical protein
MTMKASRITLNKQELHDAINDVRNLTPMDIVRELRRKRIKGRPGTTGRCPLALLMQGSHGGKFVIGQKYIIRHSGKQIDKVKTPKNLAAFVRMFDEGQFTDIIQVPPRCVRGGTAKPDPVGGNTKPIRHKRGAERLHLARDAGRFGKATT